MCVYVCVCAFARVCVHACFGWGKEGGVGSWVKGRVCVCERTSLPVALTEARAATRDSRISQ